MSKLNWVALYSFSGKELHQVLEAFPGRPVRIFTNSTTPPKGVLWNRDIVYYTPERINAALQYVITPTLVTLHGYNRILPPEVVNNPKLTIFNVHPGDVVSHPELAGLHPQRKALDLGLTETGVILHRVDNTLDLGEPVRRAVVAIAPDETEISLVDKLRRLSVPLWTSLLTEHGL